MCRVNKGNLFTWFRKKKKEIPIVINYDKKGGGRFFVGAFLYSIICHHVADL